METEEERKERVKKMVANHCQITQSVVPKTLYLILIIAFYEVSSLIKLTRTIHFLEQFIIYNACMYLCMYTNII